MVSWCTPRAATDTIPNNVFFHWIKQPLIWLKWEFNFIYFFQKLLEHEKQEEVKLLVSHVYIPRRDLGGSL